MQMLSLYKLCDRLTNLGGGTFLPGLTNHCPVVTSLLSSLIRHSRCIFSFFPFTLQSGYQGHSMTREGSPG